MVSNIKYGLFEYKTENIGDEIQSIAARRFLPRIDYFFDRDNIDSVKTKPGEKVKLIMNGWYTHHPENWPPKNPNLDPLLVAMHIEQDALNGAPALAFISPESKKFLNKFGPVGARNISTFEFLQKNNIESYFSGCITLTLNPDPEVKKQEFVLAVDVSDNVYHAMLKNTSRTILRLDTSRKKDLDRDTRFLLAELWLYLYQSAHAVVTTRLHTMLPCLAFGTPVLAISGRDPKRYKGLIDLTNNTTSRGYINDPSIFDLNRPPKNPVAYLKIREQLEKTCLSFTNYNSHNSYLDGKKISELLINPKIAQFFLDASFSTWLLEEVENQNSDLQHQVDHLAHIKSVEQNLGIKESTKYLARAVRNRFKRKS